MSYSEHGPPVSIATADAAKARVLQITDPHLMADDSATLLGVRTRDSLNAVVQAAGALRPAPDLLLATGDLAQDASEAAYHEFGRQVGVFGCPQSWVAGNHDNSEVLNRVAARYQATGRHFLLAGWQVILLDSSVQGQVYGRLGQGELRFLADALAAFPDRPALISLHHHPVRIDAEWMNAIGLQNRDQFWQVVDRFPQVRAVLWGHIHQHLDLYRGDVRLLATPSTCIQFQAGSDDFAVEPLAPGFRWLDLYSDGTLDTGVERATDFQYQLDTDSNGY
ncbi:3',5'-cyclic-AMP phosphodiesterase [Marinobacter bryozoorum]|uniref:3',5'-cyclic-AMP phosphodiesterase n=1 Tax=Marinobacter bryozoorum TaxID=256324 RepID=UPI002006C313|nr:3',5'-cyclic-AMP phosphodiesterase [Marinobacter bryozoorum]MCK7544758.1 3',5'-cyclic-AMP phosphodiesterase [Marinobacter bryozoorum]